MRLTSLRLENWRNFRRAEVPLARRVFLVGPNASGKSNLLDVIRFLRDVADPRGGFQEAVDRRHGVSQVRCLHARQHSDVVIDVTMDVEDRAWRYRLEFNQDNNRRAVVRHETVWDGDRQVLSRPDAADLTDPQLLTQTHLEQVNTNRLFRPVADFLSRVRYLHLVPQLVRDRDRYVGREGDPYGGDFLDQLAKMEKEQGRTFASRLKKITKALRVAVPNLEELRLERDVRGLPHLQGLYEQRRPNAGWQNEDQFSDGTLRLMGLLWALLDGSAPLLLEEPELSLHAGVVPFLPSMMWQIGRKHGRQTIVSTHSVELLSDESISADEIVLLLPSKEGTLVTSAATHDQCRALLEAGIPPGEVVMSRTRPARAEQLSLLFADLER